MPGEYNRDTDHYQWAEYMWSLVNFKRKKVFINKENLDNMLDELLKHIDYKKYMKNGKFTNEFYKNISGRFKFKNYMKGNEKLARITFEFDNPETEVAMALYLSGAVNDNLDPLVDMNKIKGSIKDIDGFLNTHLYELIRAEGLKNMKYITQKPKDFTRKYTRVKADKNGRLKIIKNKKKVKQIINPSTGKKIDVGGKTYRELFGDIKMKSTGKMDLSGYNTVKYKIKNGCVPSIFENKKIGGKKNKFYIKNFRKFAEKHLGKKIDFENDGVTYLELFKIIRRSRKEFHIRILSVTGHIIDELEYAGKPLDIIITSEHAHLLGVDKNNQCKERKKMKDIDDIDKYENCILYTDNEDIFNSIKKKIEKKCTLTNYDSDRISYKTNIITYDTEFECDVKLLKDRGSKCKSIYNLVESDLEMKGYLNKSNTDYFGGANKIRIFDGLNKSNVKIDMNKAYVFVLSILSFGIPDLSDKWTKYNNSDEIINYGIYYCKVVNPDRILAARDDIYSGYSVKELKKEGKLSEILYKFVCKKSKKVNNGKMSEFTKDLLRRYVGWLQKRISITTHRYQDIDDFEGEALLKLIGNDASIIKMKDNAGEELETNELIIDKERLVVKTGVIVNFMIKDYVNIILYRANKKFLELNEGAILNSVKTDSLGYILKADKYILPKDIMGQDTGKFKLELKNCEKYNKKTKVGDLDIKYKKNESLKIHFTSKNNKINKFTYGESDKDGIIKGLLKNNKGFQLWGGPGYGKTTAIKDIIIPYLDKKDISYKLASPTIENKKSIGGYTIQEIIQDKTLNQLTNMFKDVGYLIIDESSQLSQQHYKYLEYIKLFTECKIILCGDQYQTKSIDAVNKTWIITDFVYDLTDRNIVEIVDHDKTRGSEKLKKILKYVKDNFYSPVKVRKYIREKLNKNFIEKSCTRMNVAYYNKTVDAFNKNVKDFNKKNKTNVECKTIHTTQGKTIKEKYTIFNFSRIPTMDILYTALSRAKDVDQIYIVD